MILRCLINLLSYVSKRYQPGGKNIKFAPECDVPVPGIPGTGNFLFFWWYRNRYRKKLVPEKSIGTGIGKIWYRKKVPVSVSEKFGTGKKYRNRYRKNLVPEKVSELVPEKN